MAKVTIKDVRYQDSVRITDTLHATIKYDADDCAGAPWDECDGHGVVSDWTRRGKRPGERVLCEDRGSKRYYNVQESQRIALRDGWDAPPYRDGTARQRAARAVDADYEYLRQWCASDWRYMVVTSTLFDGDVEVASDSLCMVESYKDYQYEAAAEMLNGMLATHDKETKERAHWAARDVATV